MSLTRCTLETLTRTCTVREFNEANAKLCQMEGPFAGGLIVGITHIRAVDGGVQPMLTIGGKACEDMRLDPVEITIAPPDNHNVVAGGLLASGINTYPAHIDFSSLSSKFSIDNLDPEAKIHVQGFNVRIPSLVRYEFQWQFC